LFENPPCARNAITLDELEFKRAVNQTLLHHRRFQNLVATRLVRLETDHDPTPEEIWKDVLKWRTKQKNHFG
jgi:hypothetical protein